mgnify:CR=1 FL=1
MDMFWLNHEQLLKGVNLGFQRYLSRQVKWDRRLIGIFGAKGVGKTTLLLQRIKLAYGDSHEALYLPLSRITDTVLPSQRLRLEFLFTGFLPCDMA